MKNNNETYVKDLHLIDKKSVKYYTQKLFEKLIFELGLGDYCFDAMNIKGVITEKGILLDGSTKEFLIYDCLSRFENEGCKASHFIIESEGIIFLEVYMWFDDNSRFRIFDIKKISKSLSKQF